MEPFQFLKFKSSVLAQQCEKIGEQILNYQKYIDPIGLIKSNMGGWQSKFDMSNGAPTFPFLDEWSNYLFHLLHVYYADYIEKFYEKQFIGKRKSDQSWVTKAWININWPGDYNKEHSHLPIDPPDADEFIYIPPEIKKERDFWLPMASGSFYVTDSHNTFFLNQDPTPKTTYLLNDYIVKEKEREYIDFNAGDFWIGHSGLVHGVSENKQNVPRISMSFNIEPTLEFK
jgi:hypothetical protein